MTSSLKLYTRMRYEFAKDVICGGKYRMQRPRRDEDKIFRVLAYAPRHEHIYGRGSLTPRVLNVSP
jgi:hypothetical protein